jgi:hypothetical protein
MQVLVLPMLAPRSYTCEDVVEVHCHGGSLCSARVLAAAVALGARPAGPGEFTLRAFLAGRIDLAQAEAVQVRTHAPPQLPRLTSSLQSYERGFPNRRNDSLYHPVPPLLQGLGHFDTIALPHYRLQLRSALPSPLNTKLSTERSPARHGYAFSELSLFLRTLQLGP